MNQQIAVTGLVLALALSGCSTTRSVVREIATELGTGSDDVSRAITRSADAAGTSVDDTANAWKSRITSAPRRNGIPKDPETEAACSALSSIIFSDEDPFTVDEVLENLEGAVGAASGTPWATYQSLSGEVDDIRQRMRDGEPVHLELALLRQVYCMAVLGS